MSDDRPKQDQRGESRTGGGAERQLSTRHAHLRKLRQETTEVERREQSCEARVTAFGDRRVATAAATATAARGRGLRS